MTTTPDFAAMWAELRAELAARRESLSETACDLYDEGKDSAERVYGRAEELRDTIEYMDHLALRHGKPVTPHELRTILIAAGVTAESPDKLSDEDEQLARMERWT